MTNELHERLSALTAAGPVSSGGFFNANQHPRGQGGLFISVGGTVQVIGPGGKPVSQGKVTAINPANGQVSVKNSQTGQISTVAPNQLAAAPVSKATITPIAAPSTPVPASAPAAPSPPSPPSTNATPTTGSPPGTGRRALPTNPSQAAFQGKADALNGLPPLTQGSPAALYAYAQAYQLAKFRQSKQLRSQAAATARTQAATQKSSASAAAAAARKTAAAAKAAAAAAKKAAAAKAKAAKAATKAKSAKGKGAAAKGGYKYTAYHPGSAIAKHTKAGSDLGA